MSSGSPVLRRPATRWAVAFLLILGVARLLSVQAPACLAGVRQLDPGSQQRLLSSYHQCMARQEELYKVRGDLCVALVTGDPDRCSGLDRPADLICRGLVHLEPGFWLRSLGYPPSVELVSSCPLTLPLSPRPDPALCRQVPMTHALQHSEQGGGILVMMFINPFDGPAACRVDVFDRGNPGSEAHLRVEIPAASMLDRSEPISYDSKTRLELLWECEWKY